ncbi:MAG: twin-arginine translocation pathway signal [Marmoricola sp.]|nr:twin-arginine translocation pathway signal [Marmoricola sp.]
MIRARGRKRGLLAAGLVLVLVAVGAYVWRSRDGGTSGDGGPVAAVRAASAVATAYYTLDHRRISADIDRTLSFATGKFAREYGEQRATVVTRTTRRKLVVVARVPTGGAALERFSPDEAQVLVAVDFQSRAGTGPVQGGESRLRITLNPVGKVWKASAFDEVVTGAGAGSYVPTDLPAADLAVARAAAAAVGPAFAYDYTDLGAGLAKAVGLMTPSFGAGFRATFEKTVRPSATTKKAVVAAYVRGVAVVSRTADRARTLVFLDQVANPSTTADASQSRLFVDLEQVGGRWLVSGLTPF